MHGGRRGRRHRCCAVTPCAPSAGGTTKCKRDRTTSSSHTRHADAEPVSLAAAGEGRATMDATASAIQHQGGGDQPRQQRGLHEMQVACLDHTPPIKQCSARRAGAAFCVPRLTAPAKGTPDRRPHHGSRRPWRRRSRGPKPDREKQEAEPPACIADRLTSKAGPTTRNTQPRQSGTIVRLRGAETGGGGGAGGGDGPRAQRQTRRRTGPGRNASTRCPRGAENTQGGTATRRHGGRRKQPQIRTGLHEVVEGPPRWKDVQRLRRCHVPSAADGSPIRCGPTAAQKGHRDSGDQRGHTAGQDQFAGWPGKATAVATKKQRVDGGRDSRKQRGRTRDALPNSGAPRAKPSRIRRPGSAAPPTGAGDGQRRDEGSANARVGRPENKGRDQTADHTPAPEGQSAWKNTPQNTVAATPTSALLPEKHSSRGG